MRISKLFRRRKNLGQNLIKILLITLIFILFFTLLSNCTRPAIEKIASYNANLCGTQIINDAVESELTNLKLTHADLAKISRNEDDIISSIETNGATIFLIKTRITNSIVKKLQNLDLASVSVPLGAFTGPSFLAGYGPKVNIKFVAQGALKIQISSEFKQAGINQTLHSIYLNVTIDMVALITGYRTTVSVPTNFIILETVIVGTVPQYYTQILSSDEQLIHKINSDKYAIQGSAE